MQARHGDDSDYVNGSEERKNRQIQYVYIYQVQTNGLVAKEEEENIKYTI